ncbi:MAG TPA: Slp family lipoprotein [Methylomicrobium sp.]|nr:Slp family lipoprotein [Methylomicrobium sp.]
MKNRLFSVFYLFFIASCSTLPTEIEEPPAIDISYLQAIDNISQYKGAAVRWGGVIIDVLNEQNYSLLQLMAYPLNSYGRPQKNKPHEGRFYVKSSEFLDPAIYAKDQEVTAAGLLSGDKELTIGKKTLRLPIIDAKTIHLWPDYECAPYYYNGGFSPGAYYPFSGYYGYYGYPYYWGGYYRYPCY